MVHELTGFMVHCCAEKNTKEGKWVSVNVYPGSGVRLSLPLQCFRSRAARKGTKRALMEASNQTRVRIPLTGELIT